MVRSSTFFRSAGVPFLSVFSFESMPLSRTAYPVSCLSCWTSWSRSFATHGVSIGQPSSSKGAARFYDSVIVKKSSQGGGYQIILDDKILKTPAKKLLKLPSKALAFAIAAEWESQRDCIDPNTMPLMSIAATAIDQPQHPRFVIDAMLSFLPTDPAICRLEPEGDLAVKQARAFDPILSWIREFAGVTLEPSHSIFGASVSKDDAERIRKVVQAFDRWELASAEQLAAACKSLCLSIAAIRGHVSIQDVLKAARVEEDHQIEEWGLVEGGHDLDVADIKYIYQSRAMFVHVVNSAIHVGSTCTTLKDFLLATPRGAYTTAYMVDEYTVLSWDLHMERLVKSLAALNSAIHGYYGQYYQALKRREVEGQEDRAVQQLILPSVLLALDVAAGRRTPCSSCEDVRKTDDAITSNPTECKDRRSLMVVSNSPRVLTIVLTPSSHPSTRNPYYLDVHVAVAEVPPGSVITDDLVPSDSFAVVLPPPREVPVGKDSGWVRQRQPWEALKPKGAIDAILCREDGSLLEGMITNLFVICLKKQHRSTGSNQTCTSLENRDHHASPSPPQPDFWNDQCTESTEDQCPGGDGNGCGKGGEENANEALLVTASMADGVAWGTIRAMILKACEAIGLEVVESAPRHEHRDMWSEAFISNSLRGIQPLKRIVCPEDNAGNMPSWTVEFKEAPGPWTVRLKQQLDSLLYGTNVSRIEDRGKKGRCMKNLC